MGTRIVLNITILNRAQKKKHEHIETAASKKSQNCASDEIRIESLRHHGFSMSAITDNSSN